MGRGVDFQNPLIIALSTEPGRMAPGRAPFAERLKCGLAVDPSSG